MVLVRSQVVLLIAAAWCGMLGASSANAQAGDYPSRIVTVVAPSAPGGLYSMFARLIATKLEEKLKTTFIVENRPGAASIIGAVAVARADPDGYTLLVATAATLAVNQSIHKTLPYDPVKDFVPIALIARAPEVLVVNADLPIRSIADLVKAAKESPGILTYASAGKGSAQHLEGELLQHELGISMTHIPYRGATAALNDVAAGHVSMMFTPIPNGLGMIQSGKVRPIGLATLDKISVLPDLKPLAELGVDKFNADSWFMLVAPAKTPPAIIEFLRKQISDISSEPAYLKLLSDQGLAAVTGQSVDELRALIDNETKQWREVIQKARISPD
ncbi:MAG: family major facilitator superfamily protein [Xanthobacteraceae bacterium]|nr:family major facilitator superfamily protein [Xanthobacteraceae bacterium]